MVTIPIGTYTDIQTGIQGGFNSTHKDAVIGNELARLQESGIVKGKIRDIALVDEAQSGSTSSTAAMLLRTYFPKNVRLHYLPCKDDRHDIIVRKSVQRYKELVSGEDPGIIGYSIPVPMFFIDRSHLLDVIVLPEARDGVPAVDNYKMQMKVHNMVAKQGFKMITHLVLNPEMAMVVATEQYDEFLEKYPHMYGILSQAVDWKRSIIDLYPLNTADPKVNLANQNRIYQLNSWFTNLYREAIKHNS